MGEVLTLSTRSCAECAAPLGPTDDVCLLGHRAPDRPTSDLAELRAKVNEAFAAAETQLQLLTAELPVAEEPVAAQASPVHAAPVLGGDLPGLEVTAEMPAVSPIARPTPAALAPPPPPPPPPASQLFTLLPDAAADRLDDPITAFAPAARLDWGPEKNRPSRAAGLLKRFNR